MTRSIAFVIFVVILLIFFYLARREDQSLNKRQLEIVQEKLRKREAKLREENNSPPD